MMTSGFPNKDLSSSLVILGTFNWIDHFSAHPIRMKHARAGRDTCRSRIGRWNRLAFLYDISFYGVKDFVFNQPYIVEPLHGIGNLKQDMGFDAGRPEPLFSPLFTIQQDD